MPNIRPISDLRSYSDVLRQVSVGEPVFLTKNGHGRFAVLDIADYEKMTASLKLLSQLAEGEKSAQEHGWYGLEDATALLEKI
ncbi:MAG: type II toxin-antitoxin system prevent-host-death family antitoxin [Pseudomonadota bacterium]